MENILYVGYPYPLFYKVLGGCRLKKLIESNKRPISTMPENGHRIAE